MTLEEAHAWLEKHDPERSDWTIEWYGIGQWQAYQWFAPAGAEEIEKRGTFLECVEWVQEQLRQRSASAQTV